MHKKRWKSKRPYIEGLQFLSPFFGIGYVICSFVIRVLKGWVQGFSRLVDFPFLHPLTPPLFGCLETQAQEYSRTFNLPFKLLWNAKFTMSTKKGYVFYVFLESWWFRLLREKTGLNFLGFNLSANPFLGHCTFDSGMCGFLNDNTKDDFDWQVVSAFFHIEPRFMLFSFSYFTHEKWNVHSKKMKEGLMKNDTSQTS